MARNSVVFGTNLKWLRKTCGVTQKDLAGAIRVNHRCPSRSYIAHIETGRADPRLSTIRSIARALRVKPWVLIADPSDNVEFWRGYLDLSPTQKREVQHHIKYMLERRG